MAYTPETWVDRNVERPNTYTEVVNGDGTKTFIPSPGTVVEAGTTVTAQRMNNIEQGIATHEETAATETLAAHVELATQAEVSLGVDSTKVVTVATLHGVVSSVAVASGTLRASNDAQCSNDTATYIKQKAFAINISGIHRIQFGLYEGANAAVGRVYKNGVPFGVEHSNGTHEWVAYSEDLTFIDGDTCELWLRINTAGPTAYAKDFRLYFDVKRDVIFDITPELPVSIYP